MLGPGGASRVVLRQILSGRHVPLISASLLFEYEMAFRREPLYERCALSSRERDELLNAFVKQCRWTRVYYTWRPNSPDESDNHVVELAVAGGANAIVTRNVRDFAGMELRFRGLRIVTPNELARE